MLVDCPDKGGEVPVAVGGKGLAHGRQVLYRFLGRLAPPSQPADAVSHRVKPQFIVAKEAVLVFFANFADVSQGGRADAHKQ